jgi:endonuclease/exonuclease/phosphatase family metal-dependent hydrolase
MHQFIMKKFFVIGLLLLLLSWIKILSGQPAKSGKSFLRIGFYNAENYFDPFADTTIDYTQFNPGGDHHWSAARYKTKRQHIFKVITAMGGWHGMDIMAFAEIENRFVLEDLIKSTPLKDRDYGIIHFESPDHRGIDVGLIYRKAGFHPLFAKAIHVHDSADDNLRTRDILYVKGTAGVDTLQLFINHWPSRYGGLMATVSKRLLAAEYLRHAVDSVCRANPNAHVLILGDFNETIADKGLRWISGLHSDCNIFALPPFYDFGKVTGSIKSNSGWTIFDRVLCSKNMISIHSPVLVVGKSFHIFDAPFLLEQDKKNMGLKPNRTYNGFTYHGGFSDHLPVYVDIRFQTIVRP